MEFRFTWHASRRAELEGLDPEGVLDALQRPYRVVRSRNRRDAFQYLIEVDGVRVRAIVARDGAVLTVMRHCSEDLTRQLKKIRRPARAGPKRKRW